MSKQRFCPSCGMPLLFETEDQKRENHELRQNKSSYELLTSQIPQWIIVTDADASEWLFASHDIDDTIADLEGERRLRQWLYEQAKAIGNKKELYNTELELFNHTGSQYYSASIHSMHWKDRNALAFVLTDVSGEREQLRALQNICNYDMLTHVYNRRYGMYILSKWLSERRNFMLCFADIDNLKYVNDRFGHLEGDNYIIRISKILQEFSPNAVVCPVLGEMSF